MPIETATYLNSLDATNPLGSDPVSQTDDHLRLIKSVLKASFPNVAGAMTASHTDLNTRLVPSPSGGGKFIAMWSGITSSIPSGWQLCDGTNGTPDLRDRFIVGAGSTYTVGTSGGSVTSTSTPSGSHTPSMAAAGGHTPTGTVQGHVLTVAEMPSHQHNSGWGESNPAEGPFGVAGGVGNTGSGSTDHDNYQYLTSAVGGGQAHSHGLSMDPVAAHTHSMNPVADHTHTVDTRSPYYALCFIAKM